MRRAVLLTLLACACGFQRAPAASIPAPILPYAEPSISCDAGAEGTISGVVRHEETDAPLGSAIVVLQSTSLPGPLELMTDHYGRYRFDGLPPGTYTLQVLVGQADVSKVFSLPESAKFRANFALDPEDDGFVCRMPVMRVLSDTSMFSITDEAEARLLGVPRTIRKL